MYVPQQRVPPEACHPSCMCEVCRCTSSNVFLRGTWYLNCCTLLGKVPSTGEFHQLMMKAASFVFGAGFADHEDELEAG